MKKIYLISFCLSLTVFCATLIQSCKKNDDVAVEDKPQGKLLDNARAWFKEQSLLSPSPDSNDIQLSSFKPDWNKFKVIKNAGGTDVIGIPLSTNDGSYMEINYFNVKERNFGIIKKYNWLNGEMMIYSGTGRLQQRGLFDPTTNKISVLEKINGTNTMKLAFEDMYYLPEVTINGGSTYTPPPPPPSYTFPPAPIYTPPYDPNTNPNNTYYGGGTGGNPTNNTSSGIVTNNVTNPCLKAMVAAAIARNIQYNLKASMNGIFGGKQTIFNLNFNDAQLTSDIDGVTNVANATGNYDATQNRFTTPSSMSVNITLNSATLPGGSEEFTTATILHEALHAYFRVTNISFDHEVMVGQYMPWFDAALKSIYPTMTDYDRTALAYGGLTQTVRAMMGDQSDMLNNYLLTNTDYKTAKSGTPCH